MALQVGVQAYSGQQMSRSVTVEARTEGPVVLLLAGVHGDEYEPVVAAMQLAGQLPGLLKRGTVRVVWPVNPTAYLSAQRYGDDGLDLARICPGKENGSSTERAAYAVSQLIRESDYLVDMHTGGVMYDLSPLAGYVLHRDQEVLSKQREMALAFNLPIVWGTDPEAEGRTLSIARDEGIPAIYLEYGGGTGFRSKVVDAYTQGFVNLLRHLQMVDGVVETRPEEERYWLEDSRKDSGFLQGKMRSPAAGIFASEVELGKQVKEGDRWGTVTDPLSGEVTDVLADCDGLAFLLRNLVKVEKGDALGGILPVAGPGKTEIN